MRNEALDRAVERLMSDERFRRRFRRRPSRALRGSGLAQAEVEALKRGRADELVELGLDPTYVFPVTPPRAAPLQVWLLRNARRLVPAALLAGAALTVAAAPAPAAKRRVSTRVKIKRVVVRTNDVLKITGKVNADKAKCEKRRDLRIFIKLDQDKFPFADLRTNKMGRFKLQRRFTQPTGMTLRFQAKALKQRKGKLVCKADKSKKVALDS